MTLTLVHNIDAGDREFLPVGWEKCLDGLPPEQARRLLAACRLAAKEPAGAAALAEVLFPQLMDRNTLAPWLMMVTAIAGRIYSLSDFRGLDVFLEYYERHRPQLEVLQQAQQLEVDACYFGALVFRRPDHPHIGYWADVCLQAFETEGEPMARLTAANFLLIYRLWNGDFNGADALRRSMNSLRDSTSDVRVRLLCHSISALNRRLLVDYDGCRKEIEQGLALAEASGIHFWNSHLYMQGAGLALSRENIDEAKQWLDRMETASPPEHYLCRSGYHYMRAWMYMLADEPARALQHSSDAVRLAAESGARYPEAIVRLALAQVHMEQRRLGSALREFRRAQSVTRNLPKHSGMQYARGLAQAHINFKLGMRRRGCIALGQALAIGAQQRYSNFPWWHGDVMARLCARALEAGIEPDYVCWLINRRRLRPPTDLACPEAWPWPLRIELLGNPSCTLDDQPLEIGGKPWALLLALAGWADADGWVDRNRLCDWLWPDAEGDRAQRTLDTTLHRLRQQLGTEAMVRSRSGAIGLHPGLCHVDYWWLQRTLSSRSVTEQDVDRMVTAVETLQHLTAETVGIYVPDTLIRRVGIQVLTLLDGPLRDSVQTERWLDILLVAMPGHERLWQALIRFYIGQGLTSDALAAWERCRDALRESSGMEPSAPTYRLVEPWLVSAKA